MRLKREGGLFSPPPPEKGEGLLETGSLFERGGGLNRGFTVEYRSCSILFSRQLIKI